MVCAERGAQHKQQQKRQAHATRAARDARWTSPGDSLSAATADFREKPIATICATAAGPRPEVAKPGIVHAETSAAFFAGGRRVFRHDRWRSCRRGSLAVVRRAPAGPPADTSMRRGDAGQVEWARAARVEARARAPCAENEPLSRPAASIGLSVTPS